MDVQDSSGAAFPGSNDANKFYNWVNAGMSRRDYFAAKAMQGLLAAYPGMPVHQVAYTAYEIAEAMLQVKK